MADKAKRIFEQEIADGVIHGATFLAVGPYGEEIQASWGRAAGIGTFNAGLFSTTEDLAKLMRVYLRGGVCDGGTRLFGEAEMAEIAPLETCLVHALRAAQHLGVADAFDVRLAPCCAAIHEVSDEWRRLARSAVFISLPPKGPLS